MRIDSWIRLYLCQVLHTLLHISGKRLKGENLLWSLLWLRVKLNPIYDIKSLSNMQPVLFHTMSSVSSCFCLVYYSYSYSYSRSYSHSHSYSYSCSRSRSCSHSHSHSHYYLYSYLFCNFSSIIGLNFGFNKKFDFLSWHSLICLVGEF